MPDMKQRRPRASWTRVSLIGRPCSIRSSGGHHTSSSSGRRRAEEGAIGSSPRRWSLKRRRASERASERSIAVATNGTVRWSSWRRGSYTLASEEAQFKSVASGVPQSTARQSSLLTRPVLFIFLFVFELIQWHPSSRALLLRFHRDFDFESRLPIAKGTPLLLSRPRHFGCVWMMRKDHERGSSTIRLLHLSRFISGRRVDSFRFPN